MSAHSAPAAVMTNYPTTTDTLPSAFSPSTAANATTPSLGLLDAMSADVSPALIVAAFALFSLIYLAAAAAFRRYTSLGLHAGANPYKAASRVTAITHSTALLPFVVARLAALAPHFPYLAANTPLDSAVMAWSFAYFCQDIVHFICVEPSDVVLLLHHVICVAFYASVHTAGLGGTAMLAAVVMGEVTNPLQCAWYLAKLSGNQPLYSRLSAVFTAAFCLVRVAVVPVWVVDIVRCYATGYREGVLSGWYAAGWSAMSVAMMAGSWVWSWQLATGYLRMRSKRGRVTRREKSEVGGDEFVSVAGASSKYE